jgi:hypothetical protein
MRQRGRPSAQALVVSDIGVLDRVERARAPHDLNDEETEVWVSIVNGEQADWFSPGNIPLLVQLCRHIIHARRIGELLEKATSDKGLLVSDYGRLLKMQDRESRVVALLATKLRLTQQSITTHNGNKKPGSTRKPWEG